MSFLSAEIGPSTNHRAPVLPPQPLYTQPRTPLWRDIEAALIARGIPPNMDWTDYGAMLQMISQHLVGRFGETPQSLWLKNEADRAYRGEYPPSPPPLSSP
jgi:hypothetical protein